MDVAAPSWPNSGRVLAPLALVGALWLAPSIASACGGLWCDGVATMPVDQTGENIVFHEEDGTIEAHIEIQYAGSPESFAWVLPVQSVPEVEVGSQALFDALLRDTVPLYMRYQGGRSCPSNDEEASGCNDSVLGNLSSGGGLLDEIPAGERDPEILAAGSAGAFEWVALTGESVDEIVEWLDAEGYAQDPDAPPILQEYLDEGFVFVAVRLQAGAEVEHIHPLVVRYQGSDPCVPIRLTRIAAKPDMAVRVFFLDDVGWAPKNYQHVVANILRLDLTSPTLDNYLGVVAEAVDEAGGHAFVTEYRGTSNVLDVEDIWQPWFDAEPFESADPIQAVDELIYQNLVYLDEVEGELELTLREPPLAGLLATYLPVPDGIEPAAFYECMECHVDLIDEQAWDGAAFAQGLDVQVFEPAAHAEALAQGATFVTRMLTLLSPEEMTLDPTFHREASLPEVGQRDLGAVQWTCERGDWMEINGDTRIKLDGDAMPNFDDMPFALRIEDVPAAGPAMVLVDNESVIARELRAWNGGFFDDSSGGCRLGGERAPEGVLFLGFVALAVGRTRRRSR